MVGDAIESILSGIDAEVTSARIPDRRGSDWVIYNMISAVPMTTKADYRKFIRYRYQVDIYARTYDRTDEIATDVVDAMDNYTGTVEGVEIDRIIFDGEADMPVEFIYDEDAREDFFRRQQDYIINVKS